MVLFAYGIFSPGFKFLVLLLVFVLLLWFWSSVWTVENHGKKNSEKHGKLL